MLVLKGCLESPHKIENKTKLKLRLNSTTAHALLIINPTFSSFPLLLHYRKLLKTHNSALLVPELEKIKALE
jgi:hypothetical protein